MRFPIICPLRPRLTCRPTDCQKLTWMTKHELRGCPVRTYRLLLRLGRLVVDWSSYAEFGSVVIRFKGNICDNITSAPTTLQPVATTNSSPRFCIHLNAAPEPGFIAAQSASTPCLSLLICTQTTDLAPALSAA